MRIAILYLFLISSVCFGQTLKINITGIRNTSGSIRLGFYTTNEGFEKEQPLLVKVLPKESVKNGVLTYTYTGLKPGTYGLAILDDENNNDKMDYGLILPKEGFGFSNYYHTGLSKPTFDKFKFILKNEDKTVEIRVKYM